MKFTCILIAMFMITFSGLAQKGVYVKYETEVFASGEEAEMVSMLMNGSTMEIALSKSRTWTKTKMGTMLVMTMEMNSEKEEMTMLMSGLAGTMAFQGDPKELSTDEDEETVETTIEITEETKEILGYTCTKATATDADGNISTYWYTDKIQRPEGVSQMPDQIPGLCLEFEVMMQDGMKLLYTASIADPKVKMEDYTIDIPEGIEVLPLSELATMGMSGM